MRMDDVPSLTVHLFLSLYNREGRDSTNLDSGLWTQWVKGHMIRSAAKFEYISFVGCRNQYQSLLTVIVLTGISIYLYNYSCYAVVISQVAMIRVGQRQGQRHNTHSTCPLPILIVRTSCMPGQYSCPFDNLHCCHTLCGHTFTALLLYHVVLIYA